LISNAVIAALEKYVPKENIFQNEEMSKHTTFRVGGPADCMVVVTDLTQLQNVMKYIQKLEVPFFVLGNGSNLLVSDEGYRGIVIKLGGEFLQIAVGGTEMNCGAGVTMAMAAKQALDHSLTGLEFASGIPGTIGGGVVMNAGAYGGEMSQVVLSVQVMDHMGEVMELSGEDMEFGYRHSAIKGKPFLITRVRFRLTKGDAESIRTYMNELAAKRREKQPLEYPSAGSTFKRPEGYFAGKLIEDAGLRGFQIGGAQVSEKHCGFVINKENATAADIRQLMKTVQERVYDQFDVRLEPEVIILE